MIKAEDLVVRDGMKQDEAGMKKLQGINVQRATGLRNADKDTSDPYFICRIGSLGSSWSQKAIESGALQFISKTIPETLDPQWDATFSFDLLEDWAQLSSQTNNFVDQGLEITLMIYDEDVGKDDFLGSVTVDIPKDGQQHSMASPLTGEKARGNVTIAFYVPEGMESKNENCTCTGGPTIGHDNHFLNNWLTNATSHAERGFEQFLQKAGKIFGSSYEGCPEPSISYFISLKKLLKIEYSEYLMSRSNDGGQTAQILESGTTAILSYEAVITEMESFCKKWVSGSIYRGKDLGLTRLNSKMWEDLSPPHMTLTAPVDQHAIIRPLLDRVCGPGGNWNEKEILEHASNYLENIIKSGSPLRIQEDISIWICTYLHKVMLNIDLNHDEAKSFITMQGFLRKIMFLPENALNVGIISRAVKLKETRDFRKQEMEKFATILATQYQHLTSEADLHIAAAGFFDALMLAGGLSVPQGIHNALAVIYSPQSPKNPQIEVNDKNLPTFVWEVLRFYPLVPAVPYYTGIDQKERRLITMTTALRDPRVWGEDADEFKLRDLAQYDKLSTIWADKMVDKQNAANNRVCPGKDLSYQMILNFLKAFLQKKDKFHVDQKVSEIMILPQINANGQALGLSSWEFETKNIQVKDNNGDPSIDEM